MCIDVREIVGSDKFQDVALSTKEEPPGYGPETVILYSVPVCYRENKCAPLNLSILVF